MANIKSAKKRVLIAKRNAMRNKPVKTHVKNTIKAVKAAVAAGNKSEAENALKAASSAIQRSVTKGVYHKNNAARKLSHLALAVNKMA